jgi:protein involved in polysaccharide export with SLBB domain
MGVLQNYLNYLIITLFYIISLLSIHFLHKNPMKKVFFILFAALFIFISLNLYAQEINPGDGVRISYNIGDVITGDYYIQPNGLLNLPYIGTVDTKNKDFGKIKSEIESRYTSLYKNPDLSVNALFRINILGEVRNPGFYYVSDYEKFTAILAFAGGTTDAADLNNIKLIRNYEQIDISVETIIQEGSTATEFGLQSGDEVFVPRTWWTDNSAWVTIAISAAALIVGTYAVFFAD